jgi:hypothetical protein
MGFTRAFGLVVLLCGLVGGLLGALEHPICLAGPNWLARRFGPLVTFRACVLTGLVVELLGLWLYFYVGGA